jgi:hypothetical protein
MRQYGKTNRISGWTPRTKPLHIDEHYDYPGGERGLPINIGYHVSVLSVEWAICGRFLHDMLDYFFAFHNFDSVEGGPLVIILAMQFAHTI